MVEWYLNFKDDCPGGDKKLVEQQGPCLCAVWTSWSEDGVCSCDNSFQNCKQNFIRECEPVQHYDEEKGEKWSINATTSCIGNSTDQITCSGIYGNWAKWTSCDKSCVHNGQQSIRTRQRHCDDSITSSGKIL